MQLYSKDGWIQGNLLWTFDVTCGQERNTPKRPTDRQTDQLWSIFFLLIYRNKAGYTAQSCAGGQGPYLNHLITWAGAVRPKTTKIQKKYCATDWWMDRPKDQRTKWRTKQGVQSTKKRQQTERNSDSMKKIQWKRLTNPLEIIKYPVLRMFINYTPGWFHLSLPTKSGLRRVGASFYFVNLFGVFGPLCACPNAPMISNIALSPSIYAAVINKI